MNLFAPATKSDNSDSTQLFCGTRAYMAPEIYKCDSYSYAVDRWAMGVIMYEMYFKQRPWTGTDLRVMAKRIKEEPPVFPKIIDDDAKDVMMKVSFILL